MQIKSSLKSQSIGIRYMNLSVSVEFCRRHQSSLSYQVSMLTKEHYILIKLTNHHVVSIKWNSTTNIQQSFTTTPRKFFLKKKWKTKEHIDTRWNLNWCGIIHMLKISPATGGCTLCSQPNNPLAVLLNMLCTCLDESPIFSKSFSCNIHKQMHFGVNSIEKETWEFPR